MKAAYLAAGLLIGATLVGSAGADDGLDQQVAQLNSTLACISDVSPYAVEQLHGTSKFALVATHGGAQTFAHPSRFRWIVEMKPSCASAVSR